MIEQIDSEISKVRKMKSKRTFTEMYRDYREEKIKRLVLAIRKVNKIFAIDGSNLEEAVELTTALKEWEGEFGK